ncbi:FecR family protein [Spirosoma soli]|uniref:FecR family protein n=1 Tax=Spirosoma soli TaxID=1770529 RepID=A0ABW5M3Z2_9BACT
MNTYKDYLPEDFFWDDAFRRWVLAPTPDDERFWQDWLTEHPEKVVHVDEARRLVQAVTPHELLLTDLEVQRAVQQTMDRLPDHPVANPETKEDNTPVVPLYRRTWLRVAASILVIVSLAGWLWVKQQSLVGLANRKTISYEQLVANQSQKLVETVNATSKAMPVKLSDGTLVMLQPGSRVSYAPTFSTARREVYVTGEAFFEVTKNPEKPFLVYANELLTKVLGTSFVVRARDTDPQILVEVKTGRVSVFAQADPESGPKVSGQNLTGVVVTPNQRIVYAREEERMSQSLVNKSDVMAPDLSNATFAFDDTPASEVFKTLAATYGVDIQFDEKVLAKCPLTATLTTQPLFAKLDAICKVIEASYEVVDGQIVIKSKGCQ